MKFQPDKKQVIISLLVIATFAITFFIPRFYAYGIYGRNTFNAFPIYYKILLCHGTSLLLCFLVTFYLASFSFKKMLEMLGLNRSIALAFVLALSAALPLILGMQYLHGFNKETGLTDIWINGINPGFYEEILFRGFMIGILVRYAKWPAIIPIVLSSLLFAMGHLYQAHNISESIIVFCTAFGAGAGFYLFYKYTNWNLWFPLFLHSFMDTATTISNWHGSITMSLQDNIFRGITLFIAIYISYRISKNEKMKNKFKNEELPV
ncbi:MAG: type II CAAX endopeptidase family protein [Bacteroidetes bacterium]|nr:type II CAAX endopeptidase family protein [Bacteroidota bacterium]